MVLKLNGYVELFLLHSATFLRYILPFQPLQNDAASDIRRIVSFEQWSASQF